MAKKSVVTIVEEILEPFLTGTEIELADVEFVKEGKDWFLRVFIAKADGISLDNCKFVSDFLNKNLDELDPIEQQYFLEVSSPGIDRPLKKPADFEKYQGSMIDIFLYKAMDGQKVLTGKLMEYNEEKITIELETGKEITILNSLVSQVKLAIIF